jgi:hypothetical protein
MTIRVADQVKNIIHYFCRRKYKKLPPIVAEGLPLRVEASELQPPFVPGSLSDCEWRLNGIESLEYMHLLVLACEMVLTAGVTVALSFVTPKPKSSFLFWYYMTNCVCVP